MTASLLLILLFACLYAGLHSLMALHRLKEWGRRHLPGFDRWYRLVYNGAAVIGLLPLLWLGQLPDRALYALPAPWSWACLTIQGLSAVALVLAILQANPAYFVGLAQLFGDPEEEGDRLVVRGLYRWVRHPLYLFSILFLWFSPVMTVNRLLLNALATLYFVVGSIHEERRLARTFGQAYRDYQRSVPRLFPRLGRAG